MGVRNVGGAAGGATRGAVDAYRRILTSEAPLGALPAAGEWETWRPGRAEGPLIGGLLNRLLKLQATPFAVPLERFDGAILFWEEVRAPTPTIWYDLHVLRLAGILDRIAGMVVGTPTEMDTADGPDTLREIVLDVLGDRDIPSSATSTSATAPRTSRFRSASVPSWTRTPERSRCSRVRWSAPNRARPVPLRLSAAGAADLVGVVVRVAGVDAQPVVHRVRAGVRVGAGALPLRVGQRLEQLEAGGTHAGEDGEGRFDRAVVVEPPGELLLVVPDDRRVVLGDEPAQPDVCGGLAVGEVMGNLASSPAVGRSAIELVGRDAGEGVDDVVIAGSEAIEEGGSVHAAQSSRALPLRWTISSLDPRSAWGVISLFKHDLGEGHGRESRATRSIRR